MKIGFMADIHAKSNSGVREDFEDILFNKLEQVFSLDCETFIIAGDIWDSWRTSKALTGRFMALLNKYLDKKVLSIYGNHDIIARSHQLDNTSYGLLMASGLVTHLDDNPYSIEDIDIYGASYGLDHPVIKDKNKYNILVTHEMVINDKKLWHDQSDYKTGKSLLREDYDCVLSGDNHQAFDIVDKDKILVNPGSLMRLNIGQVDHKPRIVIFDTETKEIESHYLDCKPFEEIFKVEENKSRKEQNNNLQILKDVLRSGHNIEIDYKDIVWKSSEEEGGGVKSIIEESFCE